MRIQQVCQRTGLTKKAIYFYIEEGLVSPQRCDENHYLEFSEDDVRSLQIIALLRQWDMPVSEVHELFDYPSMTNFYLHRRLNALRNQLLRQLGLVHSLSALLTELPPQYNMSSMQEQIGRSTAPSEADQSTLDLLCPDQDARMISIFIWSSFLNVSKSEYRLFLWRKMTEQAQQDLKGSLKYVARIIYALDSEWIEKDARQRYRDTQAILKLDETTFPIYTQRILDCLHHLVEDDREQAYWKLNYEKVTLPLVQFFNGPLGTLMAEYNPEYRLYLTKMQQLVAEVVRRLQTGGEQALYQQLQILLAGQLDIEKDGNLLGYYAFEMGLYRSLPLDVQRRLLIESNREASPLSR